MPAAAVPTGCLREKRGVRSRGRGREGEGGVAQQADRMGLYGTVRDMGVHVGKCISGKGGRNVAIHAAKFLTDGDELMARSSVKQLSCALGVFRFVWEAVNTGCDSANHNGKDVVVKKKNEDARGVLELQRHLWSCGVEDKTVTYRGDVFFLPHILCKIQPYGQNMYRCDLKCYSFSPALL